MRQPESVKAGESVEVGLRCLFRLTESLHDASQVTGVIRLLSSS